MGDFVEPPPNPNNKALVFCFFQFLLANQQYRLANPTNIAYANPEPPTRADRVVPIHGWRTQKDQRGGQRGEALGFHRVQCLGSGSAKSPTCGK